MTEPAENTKPSHLWLKNNLVALGSAAVFTVYSAGYFRTREAAERFAGESVQRRSAVALSPESNVRADAPVTSAPAQTASAPAVIEPSSSKKSAKASHAPETAHAAPAATASAEPAAPVAPPVTAPATAPVASAPAPAPAPTVAAPAVDSSANASEKKSDGKLKDGVFYGWGTSRHGDIQASVEIENGKIIGAYISQCRTQYSCSWVSALPGQVVQRQSADVDYVSGATQSSNAFYYGVIEALKKARGL
ncbi:MAG TPA: FMN-binding protein [Gemmatimonadaceae bacterium]|jgi:uncharacterized protein with FMN-binding domain|nr:FMN-binding protein [Gemmatimonadaceae bacterium]